MLQLPAHTAFAIGRLEQAGFAGYCVGGCVRDCLLGRAPADWDITTDALPGQVKAAFADCRLLETGLRHGTLTLVYQGELLEITTFRVDGPYTDGRHPDTVSFTSRLELDLSRRDFTVNAIAYAPRTGLIDPFGGQQDLRKRQIRCVGEPQRRFAEDALRILRALRFSSTLGFSIAPDTALAVHANAPLLGQVSAERITQEFEKLLLGENAGQLLADYADVIGCFLPGFSAPELPISRLPQQIAVRLAAAGACYPPDRFGQRLQALKFPHETVRLAVLLRRLLELPLPGTRTAIRRALHLAGPDALAQSFLMQAARGKDVRQAQTLLRQTLENGDCWERRMLAVSGKDLLHERGNGCRSGAWVGETLDYLLDGVIAGRFPNQPAALLDAARRFWAAGSGVGGPEGAK